MRRRIVAAIALVSVAAVLAGCGGQDRNVPGDGSLERQLAKEASKGTPLSEEEAEALMHSFGGDAHPADLPDGWFQLRDGMWVGPPNEYGFAPNVNVLQSPVPTDEPVTAQDLLAYDEGANEYLSEGRYRKLDERDVRVFGAPGRLLEGVSKVGGRRTHVVQYYVVVDGDAFAITGTTDARAWKQEREVVQDVMDSFVIGGT